MSETPKLLALMAKSRDLNALDYSKQLEVLVRQLERENAALRDAIAESEEFAKKNGETCGLKIRDLLSENAALADENRRLHVELDAYHNGEQLRHMRAENAALREQVRRLEQDLSIMRQQRCHDIVESEKEDA